MTSTVFWQIREVHLGQDRPALPPLMFKTPPTRNVSTPHLRQWIREHRRNVTDCNRIATRWRNNPAITDGQWLANLHDCERSVHRIVAYSREIQRRSGKPTEHRGSSDRGWDLQKPPQKTLGSIS